MSGACTLYNTSVFPVSFQEIVQTFQIVTLEDILQYFQNYVTYNNQNCTSMLLMACNLV